MAFFLFFGEYGYASLSSCLALRPWVVWRTRGLIVRQVVVRGSRGLAYRRVTVSVLERDEELSETEIERQRSE